MDDEGPQLSRWLPDALAPWWRHRLARRGRAAGRLWPDAFSLGRPSLWMERPTDSWTYKSDPVTLGPQTTVLPEEACAVSGL